MRATEPSMNWLGITGLPDIVNMDSLMPGLVCTYASMEVNFTWAYSNSSQDPEPSQCRLVIFDRLDARMGKLHELLFKASVSVNQ